MSGSKGQEIVYTWARLNTPTHKELSDTIDAALRRAKAEGVKEAGKIARRRSETVAPVSKRWELNMINKTKCEEAASIADELDARAAQIEEGE